MSDRPPHIDPLPDQPQVTGGWHRPHTPGGWRPPSPTPPPAPKPEPTLPDNLGAAPASEGTWHLPRPEDTILGPAIAEAESAPAAPTEARPDELALIEAARAAAAGEPETPAPTADRPDELALIEAARAAAGEPAEAEAEPQPPAPEPAVEAAPALETSSLLELEQAAEQARELEPLAEDDEDDTFSMSELITLATLAEQQPKPRIVPGTAPAEAEGGPPGEAEAPEALSQTGVDTPADYARRQLEALAARQTGQEPAVAFAGEEAPADYARRQLEALTARQTGQEPIPAAEMALPAELARQFAETEVRVRELRQMFRSHQITRDQLQAQLRQLMILDQNRVWWMMGLETDTWYRFQDGDWIADTPPHRQPSAPALPRLETAAEQPLGATQPSAAFDTPPLGDTFGLGVDEESPLPRAVPIYDPERTVVGTAGAYLEPLRPDEAPTVAGVTLPGQPVDPGSYGYVAAPGPEAMATPADVGAPAYTLDAQPTPTYDEIARRARQRTFTRLALLGALGVGGVLLLFACGIGFILIQYSNIAGQWQTQIAALQNYRPEFQTVRVLDANGGLIAELNSQQGGARTTVPLDRISPFMIHAVVALENERFYEDPGWDWIAIFRAFLQNLGSGQVESGASTITQQIARQLVLKDSTISPERKLQEIIIASEIAKQYDKNFILQLYLNEIFFGNQSYGVEAAAQFYFGHSANDLTLPESALLAGMIAAPATYDPVRRLGEDQPTYSARREATLARMRAVIQRMAQVGCLQFQHAPYLERPFCVDQTIIRQAAAQQAEVEGRTYQPREVRFKYPHFVVLVEQLVERDFPGEMFRRGFVIKTTLNPAIQDVAEAALRQQMAAMVATGVNTGSVMVTDPRSGAIRAMVGSPDFNNDAIDGQVNGALTWQQPGSAIKPVVYAAALEGVNRGTGQLDYLTPATILWDVPTVFANTIPPYSPGNFDGRFRGPIAVRYALQNSINVPAVKAYEFIGGAKFQETAQRMGLRFREDAQFGLAAALGATEVTLYDMMVAYGTLANGGVRTPLYAIESITDAGGAVVALPPRPQPVQALQPQIAYLLQNILSDDNARADQFGVNGPLTIQGLPTSNYVAAKTGTTDQNRDLWTMGFTRNLVVGVWLGRPDNQPTFVQGGGYRNVAPLWNQVMTAALRTSPPPQPFTNPGGVVEIQICAATGTLPPPGCRSLRTELFLQTQPPAGADQAFVQEVEIDTWTGLRANQFCPDNKIAATFVNITDAAALQWLNSPAGAAVAQQLGIPAGAVQPIPPAACDTTTEIPIARIVSPVEGQAVSGIVQITGSASATTFNRYQLEVASAASPNTFTIVSGPSTTPQPSGQLGTWNTTTLPNGGYILRLAMFANNGGYLYRTVQVAVNNVQPTPTPTLPPAILPTVPLFPTEPPIFPTAPVGFTPLPFDTVAPP